MAPLLSYSLLGSMNSTNS
uniref:Uncharacterized protein n=1 Tax=Arundo donax TaxID=35708 RepID=A0A0A9C4I2_ARUDO